MRPWCPSSITIASAAATSLNDVVPGAVYHSFFLPKGVETHCIGLCMHSELC
jgi:hypothetical protein